MVPIMDNDRDLLRVPIMVNDKGKLWRVLKINIKTNFEE
jgi:hypothetical protein